MYPYIIEGVLSSYSVMMVLGIFASLGMFKLLAKLTRLNKEAYDFYSTTGVIAIAVGLCSAFLFQAVYNYFETGVFEISGLTFMGGLIGGAGTFILITIFTKKKHIRAQFFTVAEIAVPCILVAHAIGRIGCFLAGCCYGVESEHGILFPGMSHKVIPTMLYESIYLFILLAIVLLIILKFKKIRGFNLLGYAFAYSIFRFIIEYYRGDPRGAFIGPFSPSQFQSIVLFLVGCVLLYFRLKRPDIYLPEPVYDTPKESEKSETVEENETKTTDENIEKAVENDPVENKQTDEKTE